MVHGAQVCVCVCVCVCLPDNCRSKNFKCARFYREKNERVLRMHCLCNGNTRADSNFPLIFFFIRSSIRVCVLVICWIYPIARFSLSIKIGFVCVCCWSMMLVGWLLGHIDAMIDPIDWASNMRFVDILSLSITKPIKMASVDFFLSLFRFFLPSFRFYSIQTIFALFLFLIPFDVILTTRIHPLSCIVTRVINTQFYTKLIAV